MHSRYSRVTSFLLCIAIVTAMFTGVTFAAGGVTIKVNASSGNDSAARAEGAIYRSLSGALSAAQAGDTIAIEGAIGSATPGSSNQVYQISKSVTISGSASARVYGRFVVSAPNVRLKDLHLTQNMDTVSDAVTVSAGATGFSIEGGSYTRTYSQGGGVVRLLGSNGNVSITGANLNGSLNIVALNGRLTMTSNTIITSPSGVTVGFGAGIYTPEAAYAVAGVSAADIAKSNNIIVADSSLTGSASNSYQVAYENYSSARFEVAVANSKQLSYALSNTMSSGKISLMPGVYADSYSVPLPLTLSGAATISGSLTINSSDVTADGLTFAIPSGGTAISMSSSLYKGLTVSNCKFAPASSGAVAAISVKTSATASGGAAATLKNNVFSGSYSSGAVLADIGGSVMYINNNRFELTSGKAVVRSTSNGTSGSVDAQNNYWGSSVPSFGALISGTVKYEPYYSSAAMTTTNTGATTVGRDQLKQLIDYSIKISTEADADRRYAYVSLITLRNTLASAQAAYNSGAASAIESQFTLLDRAIAGLALQQYIVTTNVVGAAGGTIAPYSPLAEYGRNLTFTLLPSQGYRVKSVTVNGTTVTPTNNRLSVNVTGSVYVNVEFERVTCVLTIPTGVSASYKNGSALPNGSTVPYGSVLTFNVRPSGSPYIDLVRVTNNGAAEPVYAAGTSATFDITARGAISITAYYGNVDKSPLLAAINTAEQKLPAEKYSATASTVMSFTNALASAKNILTTANAAAATVSSALTALANASAALGSAPRYFTVYATGDSWLSVTPSVATTCSYGDTVTIQATLNTSYSSGREIKYARINGVDVLPSSVIYSGNTAVLATFLIGPVTDNITVSVVTGAVSSAAAQSLKAAVSVLSITPADITSYNYASIIPTAATINSYIATFLGSSISDSDRAGLADEYARLLSLRTAFTNAQTAASVIGAINAIPQLSQLTSANRAAIITAYNAFDSLSAGARGMVSEDLVNKLLTAADYAAPMVSDSSSPVKQFTDLVNSLPSPGSLTAQNSASVALSVDAAQTIYAGLTTAEKQAVGAAAYQKLLDLAVKVEGTNSSESNKVISMLRPGALNPVAAGDTFEQAGAKKVAIFAAKAAYDTLTDSQRALVPADYAANLTVCVESACNTAVFTGEGPCNYYSASAVMNTASKLSVTDVASYGTDIEAVINSLVNGGDNGGRNVSKLFHMDITDLVGLMLRPMSYLECRMEISAQDYAAHPSIYAYAQGNRTAYALSSRTITENGRYYVCFTAPGAGDFALVTDSAYAGRYTVSFNANGGSNNKSSMTVMSPATTLGALPLASRAGYLFNGWNSRADGAGTMLASSSPISSDMTVYASWEYVYTAGSSSSTELAGTAESPLLTLDKDGAGVINPSALASAKDLTIKSADLTAVFSENAVKTLRDSGNLELSVTLKEAPASNFGINRKSIIGDRPAYEFSIKSGNSQIIKLGGDVRITAAYSILPSDDISAIVIVAGDYSGKSNILRDCSFSTANRTITFKTNELPGFFAVANNLISFKDTSSSWAKEQITFLSAREIAVGKGADRFAPTDTLTRAEFLRMLVGSVNGIDVSSAPKAPYSDVDQLSWYAHTINWTVANDILPAISATKYGPLDTITREQMAVAIYNFTAKIGMLLPDVNARVNFPDISSASAAAQVAIRKMQTAGIIAGKSGSKGVYYDPQGILTRAEACQIIRAIIRAYLL